MGSNGQGKSASDARTARELTRLLISRVGHTGDAPDSRAVAVHSACERTYRDLTRSLGQGGADELLARAIAIAQSRHPLLKDVPVGTHLDGLMDAVRTHGAPAVTAALESVLETLLELLSRLIGEDLVARLVEPSTMQATQDDQEQPT